MQIASTQTLELDPAVSWRLVGIRRQLAPRREAPTVVPVTEIPPEQKPQLDARAGARPHREWIPAGAGGAMEFAMFVVTLAAVGFLHLQLALLP